MQSMTPFLRLEKFPEHIGAACAFQQGVRGAEQKSDPFDITVVSAPRPSGNEA
jgi:hypothetical protein